MAGHDTGGDGKEDPGRPRGPGQTGGPEAGGQGHQEKGGVGEKVGDGPEGAGRPHRTTSTEARRFKMSGRALAAPASVVTRTIPSSPTPATPQTALPAVRPVQRRADEVGGLVGPRRARARTSAWRPASPAGSSSRSPALVQSSTATPSARARDPRAAVRAMVASKEEASWAEGRRSTRRASRAASGRGEVADEKVAGPGQGRPVEPGQAVAGDVGTQRGEVVAGHRGRGEGAGPGIRGTTGDDGGGGQPGRLGQVGDGTDDDVGRRTDDGLEGEEAEGVFGPDAQRMEGEDAADGGGDGDGDDGALPAGQFGKGDRPGQGVGQRDDRIAVVGPRFER